LYFGTYVSKEPCYLPPVSSCTLVHMSVKNLVIYHLYPDSEPSVWVQWNHDEETHDWFVGLFQTALALEPFQIQACDFYSVVIKNMEIIWKVLSLTYCDLVPVFFCVPIFASSLYFLPFYSFAFDVYTFVQHRIKIISVSWQLSTLDLSVLHQTFYPLLNFNVDFFPLHFIIVIINLVCDT
jgi:hypothetical protein